MTCSPGASQEVVGGGGGGAVAQGEPRRHRGRRVDRADHRERRTVRAAAPTRRGRAGPAHSATVGSPRAIAVRSSRRSALVGAEVGGVHLGEAAAEVEPGRALGQPGVGERVELDDLGPGGLQQLGRLGVAEREGPAAGDRDPGRPGR